MKILVCCGNGIGSSFMIEMNVKKILKEMKVDLDVDHADLTSAKSAKADIYIATRDIATQLEGLGGEVVTLNNMIDFKELKTKLQSVLTQLKVL